jgi:HAD superfamily hydrolase (TIGR01509 family)
MKPIVILMLKAVIFDWDGTLAETREAVIQSFQTVLTDAGCKVSDEFIVRLMGVGTKKTIIEAFKTCNKRLNVSILEELTNKKVEIQVKNTKKVKLMAGAFELLQELYGKTKIALATMSGRQVIDKLLKEKNIKKYFDVVITANDVSKPKPDPEVFIVSASKLGIDTQKCLVIEDSVFGLRAAKIAKMKCIGIPSGAYSKEELTKEKPQLIIDSLVERKKILDFIYNN